MTIYAAPLNEWSAPIILPRRSIVQVKTGGPILVATEAPLTDDDGSIYRDERGIILDANVTVRLKGIGLMAGVVYIGRVANT